MKYSQSYGQVFFIKNHYGWCIFNGIIEVRKANLLYKFFFSRIKRIPTTKNGKNSDNDYEFRNRKGTKKILK